MTTSRLKNIIGPYKNKNHPTLPSLYRGYFLSKSRKNAIKDLTKKGYNHFVCYKDVQAEFALTASFSEYFAKHSIVYIDW